MFKGERKEKREEGGKKKKGETFPLVFGDAV